MLCHYLTLQRTPSGDEQVQPDLLLGPASIKKVKTISVAVLWLQQLVRIFYGRWLAGLSTT